MLRMSLGLALLCFGCQFNQDNPAFFHKDIPVATQKGQDPNFQGHDARDLLPVKSVDEMFTLDRIIPLETTDHALIGMVSDLLFHDNHWFILDQMTFGVYKFTANGKFKMRFGQQGAGPGEFERPKRIRLCFDNRIGVADPVQGRIHLFKTSGEFIRSTLPHPDGPLILPRYTFAWNQADSLVIAGFGSSNPAAPHHAVVDGRQHGYTLKFGFGERRKDLERAFQKGAADRAYTAFEIIDGRYWVGSPFATFVDIFNQKGELLGRVGDHGTRDSENLIQPEDIEKLHKKKDPAKFVLNDLIKKAGNERILPIGDYVFVSMGRYVDVYRRNGQRIAINLKNQTLSMNYAYDDKLVMVIPAGYELATLPEGVIKEALEAVGYTSQDNPHLAIFKLNVIRDFG